MEIDLFGTLPVEFVVRNRPPGGTTYLFSWTDDVNKDDWRADGYRWRQGGSKSKGRKLLTSKYFKIHIGPKKWSNEFVRIVCFHPDYPKTVLLKYIGDETKAVDFAHGNATKATHNYVRTQPSVIKKIKESSGTARLIYQDLSLAGSCGATSVPRNQEQVRNALKVKASRHQSRLVRDDLYSLHEFAYSTNFVRHISTFPDLVILMYSNETIKVFCDTLKNSDLPQQLSYSTTFNLGDFYLSSLLFSETEFVSRPIIPLAFMIHERKTTKTHEIFWQHIKLACPDMQSSKQVLIVTDQEQSITEAIHASFPGMPHFLCWNHILQDLMQWLGSNGLHSDNERGCYIDTIRSLFQSGTEEEYKDALILLIPNWSTPFSEYFLKNIHSVINKLGSWVLQQYGLKEITRNQSETLNSVIKQLQEWKKAPIDSITLSLYRFVQSSLFEVYQGRKCLGDYELNTELKNFYKDNDSPILAAIAPDAIVQQIRDGLQQELDCVVNESNRNEDVLSDILTERAQQIIEHGQLSLNPQLAVFTVNESQDSRVVRLFPTATCSCPTVGTCHHILAAQKAIGLLESNKTSWINLSCLRKKTHKKPEKTSTRKRPADISIELDH